MHENPSIDAAPDRYAEKITDPECLRMRDASGRVDDFRPLVAFLYELARDEIPPGRLEDRLERIAVNARPDHAGERGPFMFTNGWLARWAQDAADRLAEPVDLEVSEAGAPPAVVVEAPPGEVDPERFVRKRLVVEVPVLFDLEAMRRQVSVPSPSPELVAAVKAVVGRSPVLRLDEERIPRPGSLEEALLVRMDDVR